MEAKSEANLCDSGDKKPVKGYCPRCKVYICADCHVTKHIDHDNEIIDLAEKCTRFLADYQKLSRAASLMADRRQVHIKDESIDGIIGEIKEKIVKAKESLQGDINKTTELNLKYINKSPLIQEFVRRKTELAEKADDPLLKIRSELGAICKELLHNISDNKYESADKLISAEKLKQYDEEIKKLTHASVNDLEFIQEIRKLKQTSVDYSYDPMAIMGMIKVNTQVKKPNRIIQFDREKNTFNIYNVDTQKVSSTVVNSGFIMPFRFVSIETCNTVYINGGDNDHGHYLKSLYLYDELRGGLIPLASMLQGRSRHAVVSNEEHHTLYAIAGESAEGVIAACEVYDLKENQWKAAPALNDPRCGHSACLLGGKFIYVFGGWNQNYLSSIECLELAESKKWDTIKLSKKHNILKALQCPGMVAVKDHEIMIFGGYKEGEELSTDCYMVDTKTLGSSKGKEMEVAEAFISSEVKKFGDKIYSFGYGKGGVHCYDVEKEEWMHIPQEKL